MAGFTVDTGDGVVRIEEMEVAKRLSFCYEIFWLRTDSTMSAHALLSSASFLNFVRLIVPGGFRHLRNGWNAVNVTGITELRGAGNGRAEVQATATREPRGDMVWRRKALESRPSESLHSWGRGGFV